MIDPHSPDSPVQMAVARADTALTAVIQLKALHVIYPLVVQEDAITYTGVVAMQNIRELLDDWFNSALKLHATIHMLHARYINGDLHYGPIIYPLSDSLKEIEQCATNLQYVLDNSQFARRGIAKLGDE